MGWHFFGFFLLFVWRAQSLSVLTAFTWSSGGEFSDSYYSVDLFDLTSGKLTSGDKQIGFPMGADKCSCCCVFPFFSFMLSLPSPSIIAWFSFVVDPDTSLMKHTKVFQPFSGLKRQSSVPLPWATGPFVRQTVDEIKTRDQINAPLGIAVMQGSVVALVETYSGWNLQAFSPINGSELSVEVSLQSVFSGGPGDGPFTPFDISGCVKASVVVVLGKGASAGERILLYADGASGKIISSRASLDRLFMTVCDESDTLWGLQSGLDVLNCNVTNATSLVKFSLNGVPSDDQVVMSGLPSNCEYEALPIAIGRNNANHMVYAVTDLFSGRYFCFFLCLIYI
jgi:hypothetical protein